MPSEAIENRIADALLAALQAIGVPALNWRTTVATLAEGYPGDAIAPPPSGKIAVWLQFISTVPTEQSPAGHTTHRWRTRWAIWIAAESQRTMLNGLEDVRNALRQNEAAMTALIQQPTWYEGFTHGIEMRPAGIYIGHQAVFNEYEVAH